MGKIETATQWMIDLANDDSHGYDQDSRWGPDYDCSSSVISAWQYAGVPVKTKGASSTYDMKNVFLSCGILACIPVNIMAPVLHINRPMKKREIIICKRKVKMFTVILAVVQLFLSGCNRRNLVALISETIWLVLIFMVLGNIEYEKENHKVA